MAGRDSPAVIVENSYVTTPVRVRVRDYVARLRKRASRQKGPPSNVGTAFGSIFQAGPLVGYRRIAGLCHWMAQILSRRLHYVEPESEIHRLTPAAQLVAETNDVPASEIRDFVVEVELVVYLR